MAHTAKITALFICNMYVLIRTSKNNQISYWY